MAGTAEGRWGSQQGADDDNVGVVDERDCAPFDAAVQTCAPATEPPAPEVPAPSYDPAPAPAPAPAVSEEPAPMVSEPAPVPLVTSLPSTGTGPASGTTGGLASIILIAGAVVLAAVGFRTADRRG